MNIQTFLKLPVVSRVRRNHGLEHATLHVLSRRHPGQPLSGHSDTGGFWLVGNLPTEEVYSAAQEALVRLNAGERSLAVHQNCGTNYVISGSMAALAVTFRGFRLLKGGMQEGLARDDRAARRDLPAGTVLF